MFVRLMLKIVMSLAALLLFVWMGASAAWADDAQHEEVAADHALESDHDYGEEIHAQAHGDEHGAGHVNYNDPPITPNRSMLELFLFSLILFWGFLFAARKLAWLPLIEGLDAREARVNRALADAEAARIEAQKLIAEHQAQLDEVTEQIKGIISQARTEAEREKGRIIAEAETETTAMRDKAIAQIHAAREESLSGLDERIESQITTATRHVLG